MAAEIKFDGVVYRDPQGINKQWGNYFANLYTPDEDESLDDNVKLQVENELYEIKQHCQAENDTLKVDSQLGQNFFISWFTNPPTVIFGKVGKKIKLNF